MFKDAEVLKQNSRQKDSVLFDSFNRNRFDFPVFNPGVLFPDDFSRSEFYIFPIRSTRYRNFYCISLFGNFISDFKLSGFH